MKNENLSRVQKYMRKHRRWSIWYKMMTTMAAVVVFITTYMLILPAITMERKPVCGLEEHEHTDACYEAQQVLICDLDETAPHFHDEGCFDEDGALICGLEETEGHIHTDACYEEEQVLTCGLEEHIHSDACYPLQGVDDEDAETVAEETSEAASEEITAETSAAEDDAIVKVSAESVSSGSGGGSGGGSATVKKEERYAANEKEIVEEATETPEATTIEKPVEETAAEVTTIEADAKDEKIVIDVDELMGTGPLSLEDRFNNITLFSLAEDMAADEDSKLRYTKTEDPNYGKIVSYVNAATYDPENSTDPFEIYLNVYFYPTKTNLANNKDGEDTVYKLYLPEGIEFPDFTTFKTVFPGNDKKLEDDDLEFTYEFVEDSSGSYIEVKFTDYYITTVLDDDADQYECSISFSANADMEKYKKGYGIEAKDGGVIDIAVPTKIITGNKNETPEVDLNVKKTGYSYDPETCEIKYTITVSSEKGTQDKITVKDEMSASSGDYTFDSLKSFEVTPNGNYKFIDTFDENGFTIELDKLDAGGSYEITYTFKVEDIEAGESYVHNNNVTATTVNSFEDPESYKIEVMDNDSATTPVSKDKIISKSAAYEFETETNGDDTIAMGWKIVVGNGVDSLDGMKLTDVINVTVNGSTSTVDYIIDDTDSRYYANFKITPEDGKYSLIKDDAGNITGIEFLEGAEKQYTITYTTFHESEWNTKDEVSAENTATLTDGDGNEVGVGVEEQKISLTGGDIVKGHDQNTKTVTVDGKELKQITWKAGLYVPQNGIDEGEITDNYSSTVEGYFYTVNDALSVISAFEKFENELDTSNYEITVYDSLGKEDYKITDYPDTSKVFGGMYFVAENGAHVEVEIGSEYEAENTAKLTAAGGKFTGFGLHTYPISQSMFDGTKVTSGANIGTELYTLSYTSSFDPSYAYENPTKYTNNITWVGREDDDYYPYYLTVMKTDGDGKTGSSEVRADNGVITWIVSVDVENDVAYSELKVEDIIPTGRDKITGDIISFDPGKTKVDMSVSAKNSGTYTNIYSAEAERYSGTTNGITAVTSVDSEKITTNLTGDFAGIKGSKIYLKYTYTLAEFKEGEKQVIEFTNRAVVTDVPNDKNIGEASHTQTVTVDRKSEIIEPVNKISQYSGVQPSADQLLSYAVYINPYGKPYAAGSKNTYEFEDTLTYKPAVNADGVTREINIDPTSIRLYYGSVENVEGHYVPQKWGSSDDSVEWWQLADGTSYSLNTGEYSGMDYELFDSLIEEKYYKDSFTLVGCREGDYIMSEAEAKAICEKYGVSFDEYFTFTGWSFIATKDIKLDLESGYYVDAESVVRYNTAYEAYSADTAVVEACGALVPAQAMVKGDAVASGLYTQSISESENSYSKTRSTTINLTLPDETPFVLEYDYSLYIKLPDSYKNLTNTEIAEKGITIGAKNNAIIKNSVNSSATDDLSEENWAVQRTDSTAAVVFTVYKVEKGRNNVFLPGTNYDLYKYTQNGGDYDVSKFVKVATLKSDSSGKVRFSGSKSDKSASAAYTSANGEGTIDINTLYYIVESEAPTGYEMDTEPRKIFFIASYDGISTSMKPDTLPDGTKDILSRNYTENYENEKKIGYTDISVAKKWLDKDGGTTEAPEDIKQIPIKVYRKYAPVTKADESVEVKVDIDNTMSWMGKLGADGSWNKEAYTSIYPKGTVMKISYTSDGLYDKYGNYLGLEENGLSFNVTGGTLDTKVYYNDNDNGSGTIEWEITLDADTEITGKLGDFSNSPEISVDIDASDIVGNYVKDEGFSSVYYLTAENKWELSITDLLKEGTKEIGGVSMPVRYLYYIVEEQLDGFEKPVYIYEKIENDSSPDLTSGTITLVNKEEAGRDAVLPNTGGMGTKPYTLSGTLMLICAGIFGVIKSRNRHSA